MSFLSLSHADWRRADRMLYNEARFAVAETRRVDADSITDSRALIPELRGLAWALQYLMADQVPSKNDRLQYYSVNENGLTERFTAEFGRVAVSSDSEYNPLVHNQGPRLSIVTPGHAGPIHGELVRKAIIPTDDQLDQIVAQDTAKWNVFTIASVYADRDPSYLAYSYPFDTHGLNSAGPGQYLADVQALSGRLLEAMALWAS